MNETADGRKVINIDHAFTDEAIASWKTRDDALENAVDRALGHATSKDEREDWIIALMFEFGHYAKALKAVQDGWRYDPNNPPVLVRKSRQQ